MNPHLPVPLIIATLAAGMAAITDLCKYRIYNLLTVPLLILGLIYHGLNLSWEEFAPSAIGAGLGLGTMIPLYLKGGLGAGDVKLMAGLGAWLGPVMIFQVLLASWLAAGIYSVAWLVWNWLSPVRDSLDFGIRNFESPKSKPELSHLVSHPNRRRLIPFGAMMLVGVVATFVLTFNLI